MKILIASDKFKGSLSSQEVADSIEEGILYTIPDCYIDKLYVADGGDGTMEAIVRSLDGKWVDTVAHNPLDKEISVRYGIINGDTAVLDVAIASGIALIGKKQRNPLQTTSFGTGEIIIDAINRGVRKFLIGLGGSATNDAAMGILSALGYKFLDDNGIVLPPIGCSLNCVVDINESEVDARLKECSFTLLCDVSADFCGVNGAAYLFSPQKGASYDDVLVLDAGLENFAKILQEKFGKDIKFERFSGAAGGIGGTLSAVLNAQLKQGIDEILDIVGFNKKVVGADFVITGEGAMDKTSLLGKTPFGVCRRALAKGVKTIALAGRIGDAQILLDSGFYSVHSVVPNGMKLEEAMLPGIAKDNIKRTASEVFRLLSK